MLTRFLESRRDPRCPAPGPRLSLLAVSDGIEILSLQFETKIYGDKTYEIEILGPQDETKTLDLYMDSEARLRCLAFETAEAHCFDYAVNC